MISELVSERVGFGFYIYSTVDIERKRGVKINKAPLDYSCLYLFTS